MSDLLITFAYVTQVFNLPPGLLSAVCYTESRHNANAYVHNDGGTPSIGICQLKYSTAQGLGFHGSPDDLMAVRDNVYFAGAYLRHKLDLYDGDVERALCAYNSGTCKVKTPTRYTKAVLAVWRPEDVGHRP